MARLESDKVDKALQGKMKAQRLDTGDWFYLIEDDNGVTIASTSISKGAKHTLGDQRVRDMAQQLCLNKSQLLVDLVSCILGRPEAIKIMKENCPPGTRRRGRTQHERRDRG